MYAWCLPRIAADTLDEWITELNDPLPWQDENSEAAINAESASFMAMMSKGGG